MVVVVVATAEKSEVIMASAVAMAVAWVLEGGVVSCPSKGMPPHWHSTP